MKKRENHYYVRFSRRSQEVTTTKPHSTSVEGKGDDESMTTVSNVLKVFQKAREHGCHPGYVVALVLCIIFFITTSALAVALCCEKREKRKLIEGINKGKSERLK